MNYLVDRFFAVGRWIEQHSAFVSAAATVWIAVFTAILWLANRKLWKASQEQTRQLKRSVDSIITTERADLFVMGEPHDDRVSFSKFDCKFTVYNAGRTAAILTNVNSFYKILPIEDTIPEISSQDDHGIVPDTIIIGGSPGIWDSKPFETTCHDTDPGDSSIRWICRGRIQYKDIFGDIHETGFCWEYVPSAKEFYPIKDSKCNYRT